MGYLKRFKHDIFVSYAHRDVEKALAREGPTWTRQVVDLLRSYVEENLDDLDAERLGIFHDVYTLELDSDFSHSLLNAVDEAGLLLVFVSKAYLKSKWCGAEVERFRQKQRWPDDPNKYGLFLIEVEETERDAWPDALKDTAGNPQATQVLHYKDDPDGPSKTFGFPQINKSPELCDRISELASLVRKSLESLKKTEEVPPGPPRPAGGPVVFLGYGANKRVRDDWYKLADHLKERGIGVLPVVKLRELRTAEDFEKQVRKDLQKCRLVVQLLSDVNGRYELTMTQHRIATTFKVPILFWRDPGLGLDQVDDEDEDYLEFARDVFPSAETSDIQTLAEQIVQRLSEEAETGISEGILPYDDTQPIIYIFSGNLEGYRFVRSELHPTLRDAISKRGWQPVMPSTDEILSTERLGDFYRQNVKGCDAVIVVHCQAEKNSVIETVKTLSRNYRHSNPGRDFFVAVVDGPPGLSLDLGDTIRVFDCSDKEIDTKLYDWLDKLRKQLASRSA